MINLSSRSYEKELIDQDDIPFPDIRRNMLELDLINTWLGGHAISIDGLKRFLGASTSLTVCEIGCGGGDNLNALVRYCKRKNISVRIIGIDRNPHCIEVAKARTRADEAIWIVQDYRAVDFGEHRPDIIFSSLFCHHFTDEQLVDMLRWMNANAGTGWFINDLHRHALAYYSIRWLTGAFSRSYLVRNDAPLSVRRGFIRKDWEELTGKAAIGKCRIRWKWAFRFLVSSR